MEPLFYLTCYRIYCSGTQYNKDPSFYKRLGLDGAILTITDPEQHRAYRNIINSLFSARTTNELGPIMALELQNVAKYLSKKNKENTPIIIQRVYRSVSVGRHTSHISAGIFAYCSPLVGD